MVFSSGSFRKLWAATTLSQFGDFFSYVALAWLARQPGVTAVIIGPRTVTHLHDNLAGFSLTLPPDALARLNEISRPAR